MAETPTGIMMDATYKGKDVTIYSTTGDKRTEADFAKAMADYGKNGTIPKGYTVLEPGMMNTLRQGFEAVNQPLQEQARRFDMGIPAIGNPPTPANAGPVAELLARRTPGNPEGIAGGDPSQPAIAQSIAASVNTPRKAAMTGVLAALPAVSAPVSIAKAGGGYALSKAGLFGNMAKAAVAGGTIPSLVDMATGGDNPEPYAKAAGDAVVAGLTNGVQGVLGHFITKYLKADVQEEAARNIIKPIAEKYKGYGSDPTLFDAVASSPKQLEDMTAQLSKSLMGSAEKVAGEYKDQLVSVLPRAMSVGDQATLRAHMRRVTEKAQDALDYMGSPKDAAIAQQAMDQAIRNTGKFLTDRMQAQGIKNMSKTDAAIAGIMGDFKREMMNFNEGVHVLSAMQRSGQQNGFDPMAFREALLDMNYRSGGPQSLLAKVGNELGMGASLNKTENVPSASGMLDKVIGSTLRRLPAPLRKFLAPEAVAPTPMMPWMMQGQGVGGTTIPLGLGVQSKGQEAMDSFMNRKDSK